MNNQIKYKTIHIGKFKSDDEKYAAVVIYNSENIHHVTIYRNNKQEISAYMAKKDWTLFRDVLELDLYDIQDAEFPEESYIN